MHPGGPCVCCWSEIPAFQALIQTIRKQLSHPPKAPITIWGANWPGGLTDPSCPGEEEGERVEAMQFADEVGLPGVTDHRACHQAGAAAFPRTDRGGKPLQTPRPVQLRVGVHWGEEVQLVKKRPLAGGAETTATEKEGGVQHPRGSALPEGAASSSATPTRPAPQT